MSSLGVLKTHIFYGDGENHFRKIKIRFCDDKSCDEILKKLGEDRSSVKIRYERPTAKTVRENQVDWGLLPKLTVNPPHAELVVAFENQEKLEEFYEKILNKPYKWESGIFYPHKPRSYPLDAYWLSSLPDCNKINQYPLCIISKGRYQPERSLTHNWFSKHKIKHWIFVENCEYEQYKQNMNDDYTNVVSLPPELDNLGQGSIPVRNYVDKYWEWDERQVKEMKYWLIDDNIKAFYRWEKNTRREIRDTTPFRVLEDFAKRYKNLYLSGFQYKSFLPEISRARTCVLRNTRIYSCMLISTELNKILGYELWRGKYNEDTDLSLRLLKKGYPTVLHQQFLCDKATTKSIKGGNTSSIYQDDGLEKKVDSLIKQHPDVVKKTFKFKKVHHQVNYKPFKYPNNKLITTKKWKRMIENELTFENNYGLVAYTADGKEIIEN